MLLVLAGFHQRKGLAFTFQNSGSVNLLVSLLAAWLVTTVLGQAERSIGNGPDYQQQRHRKKMRWRRTLGTEANQTLP